MFCCIWYGSLLEPYRQGGVGAADSIPPVRPTEYNYKYSCVQAEGGT
jgi:hypothetical protein